MKIYNNIEEFKGCKNAVVTTGTFDGVHLGHQKILTKLKNVAKKINGETVLITFHPHPRMVLQPESNGLKLIDTIEERIALLEKQGIDHLIVHPFSKEFSRLTSVQFVRDILVGIIGTKKLIIGFNHQFGRNREGSFEHLLECGPIYGFDVEEIEAKDVKDVNISSTKIRNAIASGDISIANKYLGRPFSLSGKVIEGNKIGREIGFPTANITIGNHKILPEIGVYAVDVLSNEKQYKGMLNIGVRPTVAVGNSITIEVNIFDFDKNIYNQNITLLIKKHLRNEQKFKDIETLRNQLIEDKIMALNCW